MPQTSSNLSELRDIVLPEAPGLWPLAPGLWALIGLVGLLGIAAIWWFWQQRQRNRYRRAGLLLLANASTTYEVSVILKRVALAVYPREEVAALHGAAWAGFLGFKGDVFVSAEAPVSPDLRKLAEKWIRKHQVERPSKC